MRRLLAIAIPATALLFAASCASTDDVKALNRQVNELQEQLAQVKSNASSKQEVQNVNTKIAEQTQTLLKSNAALSVKVNEIDDKMQNTQGTIEQTNYRVDRLVQQMTQIQHDLEDLKAEMMRAAAGAATGTPSAPPASGGEMNVTAPSTAAGAPAPAPAAPGEDPIQMYQSAFRDYQRGNFDLAIAGFRDFEKRNPASDLADNAAYWIAECLYSQKKYREAIEQFDLVVTRYPKSDKVPAALLKKGYGYINLGEKAQGVVQLQYVVHEHPGSEEASLAKQKLRALGIETK